MGSLFTGQTVVAQPVHVQQLLKLKQQAVQQQKAIQPQAAPGPAAVQQKVPVVCMRFSRCTVFRLSQALLLGAWTRECCTGATRDPVLVHLAYRALGVGAAKRPCREKVVTGAHGGAVKSAVELHGWEGPEGVQGCRCSSPRVTAWALDVHTQIGPGQELGGD